MRAIITTYLFIFSLSISAQNFSERKTSRIINKIDALNQAHVSITVFSQKTSKYVVSYQSDYYMTPASNIKLFTFLAAIENFDSLPALYYHNQDSVTHFKSTGYPLLFHPFYPDQELSDFLRSKTNLVYHLSKSEVESQGPGWSWDDYPYYFAAERSSFPIYGNTIQAFGKAEAPQFIPNSFEIQPSQDTLSKVLIREPSKNRFYYNPNKWNALDTLYSPFITGDRLFVRLLAKNLKKPVELSNESKTLPWKLLYTGNEKLIYRALLQDSDNGIAEALLAMISQKKFNKMNIDKAIEFLKVNWGNWLTDPIEWVDGSGISRYNMVTSRTLIAVLKKIYSRVGIQTIKNYFPQIDISETLKKYNLKNVYAKTGSLRNNHNFSGYWISTKGNIYVFSIMVNHFTSPKIEISQAIGQLLNNFQKKMK